MAVEIVAPRNLVKLMNDCLEISFQNCTFCARLCSKSMTLVKTKIEVMIKILLKGLCLAQTTVSCFSSYNKDVLPHHHNSFAMHSYDSQVDISSRLLAWRDFQFFTHVIRFEWMEFPSDPSTHIWQNHSHSSRYVLK